MLLRITDMSMKALASLQRTALDADTRTTVVNELCAAIDNEADEDVLVHIHMSSASSLTCNHTECADSNSDAISRAQRSARCHGRQRFAS